MVVVLLAFAVPNGCCRFLLSFSFSVGSFRLLLLAANDLSVQSYKKKKATGKRRGGLFTVN